MDYKIDLSTYSLEELYSAAETIDRQAHPERANQIDALIREKEKQLPPSEERKLPFGEKAARFDRLLAVLVDVVISFAVLTPVILYLGWDTLREPTISLALIIAAYALVAFAILHGYLLYQYGQTIGKRVLNIRIENLDGSKASLRKIIFLRMLPVNLFSYVPVVGGIVTGIVNPLFIFGKQRRCLHDYIAKTKVSYTDNK